MDQTLLVIFLSPCWFHDSKSCLAECLHALLTLAECRRWWKVDKYLTRIDRLPSRPAEASCVASRPFCVSLCARARNLTRRGCPETLSWFTVPKLKSEFPKLTPWDLYSTKQNLPSPTPTEQQNTPWRLSSQPDFS